MLGSAYWYRPMAAMVIMAASTVFMTQSPSGAQDEVKPVRALLVIGGCCHDYNKQKDLITQGISKFANVQWKIAYDSINGTTVPHRQRRRVRGAGRRGDEGGGVGVAGLPGVGVPGVGVVGAEAPVSPACAPDEPPKRSLSAASSEPAQAILSPKATATADRRG